MDVNNVRFGNYSIGNSNARQLKDEQKPAEEKTTEAKQNQNAFINPDKAMDVLAAQGMMNMAQVDYVSRKEVNPTDYLSEDRIADIEAMMGKFDSGVNEIADVIGNEIPLSPANRLALAAHIFAEG